jgi:hypothetical protein
MQQILGIAVIELRRRKEWDQSQLAREIHRFGKADRLPAPTQITVSRWETAVSHPSNPHRLALAKIASTHGLRALGEVFRAPPEAWTLVSAILDIGVVRASDPVLAQFQPPVQGREEMKTGDTVWIYPVSDARDPMSAHVDLLSSNGLSIAIRLADKPVWFRIVEGVFLRKDGGSIEMLLMREATGPWRDVANGQPYEIEESKP